MSNSKRNIFIAGLAAGATLLLYVVPAFALTGVGLSGSTDLCPTNTQGITLPGCGSSVGVVNLVNFAINALLFVAFVAALIFLIIGGIRWILSGGDKEATGKAKNTVTSALIGLVVVLAAWVLVNVVIQLITGGSLSQLSVPSLNGCPPGQHLQTAGDGRSACTP